MEVYCSRLYQSSNYWVWDVFLTPIFFIGGDIMIDFSKGPDVNDKVVLDAKIDPLHEIVMIFMNNGVDFTYRDDVVSCSLKNGVTQEDIMSIIRTNIPFSIVLLDYMITTTCTDNVFEMRKAPLAFKAE